MPALIEKQKPLPTEETATPVAGTIESPETNQNTGFFVSRRKLDLGQNSSKAMTIAAIVAVLAIGGVFALSHREGPGVKKPQAATTAAPVKPVAQSSAAYTPGDQAAVNADGNMSAGAKLGHVAPRKRRYVAV